MSTARAALVTGGSSGIGLAIARTLGAAGYDVTLASRRPDRLEQAAHGLREEGYRVATSAGDLGDEAAVVAAVETHRAAYGRLDVLVNNAGVGIGQFADDLTTKAIDIQLNTNLRSIFLFYREALPMLREAGGEHRNALVINVSSASGIHGERWLGVYSATKRGLVGFTQAMNRELNDAGIKSTALCPAFVDTPMASFVKDEIGADKMISVDDVAGSVRYLLTLSPGCLIPEIQFEQTIGAIGPTFDRTG
ncbi:MULTISPECIES: SDR family oxidoreductase [unclassified Nocardioides]|uniref:SDR family oxidoreductase n=1 Tax=unclassified Nocardioides TaxID=2615069 RepID=UPI0000570AB8|nr:MULTISPECIES: SDR family oxidoreductase [unclassified Nocardioides]ABL80321.1 short-chain dehydrogenase/reductase SDR [Nocardioides sp. JS614]